MSTFLTYVLAALAASVVFHGFPIVSALARGEGYPIDGIATLMMTVPISMVLLSLIVAPLWAVSGLLVKAMGLELAGFLNPVRGAILFALIAAVIVLIASTLYGSQDAAGATTIAMYFGAAALPVVAGFGAIMGLAWGTVFWMRTPKLQNTGAAA